MRSINTALTLKDLPPPPEGKTGWPWTEEIEPLPSQMVDGSEFPKISIVTPSYNYGRFIEETIRSVLLQGYPNLEYIIIDGGSTDNTIEIIQKYEEYLSYSVSELDEGQTDAINKGYQHCTGNLFVWLNADDAYINSTCLKQVSELYKQGHQLIVGECLNVDSSNNPIQISQKFNGYSIPQKFEDYLKFWSFVPLPQPAVFIDKQLTDRAFPLDKTLRGTMDYQLFLRVLSQSPRSIWVKQTWVKFKYHGDNKTMSSDAVTYAELYRVAILEAQKNYNIWRQFLFQISCNDFLAISPYISDTTTLTLNTILRTVILRPTLISWLLFWKMFIKALISHEAYQIIKKMAKHS
ncbi:MAG: glycosyltransferase [Calothrix sp. C42_A2020_038]|nr:glycosyltransferase [Calothrix sp. C42_A2020_038]